MAVSVLHFHSKHSPFLLRYFRICNKEFVNKKKKKGNKASCRRDETETAQGFWEQKEKKSETTFASATQCKERKQHARECEDINYYLLKISPKTKSQSPTKSGQLNELAGRANSVIKNFIMPLL